MVPSCRHQSTLGPACDHSAGRLAPWRPLPNLPSHEVESRWMRRTQQLGLLVRSIPGSNSRFSSATDELDRRSREPGRWGWGWGSSALFPGWRASELALVRLGQVRKGKGTGVFPFRKPATWHDRGAPIGLPCCLRRGVFCPCPWLLAPQLQQSGSDIHSPPLRNKPYSNC